MTCERQGAAEAAQEADLQAGPEGAWSAAEAVQAVQAEEKIWRLFLARRGAQVAFAREGPTAKRAEPQPPKHAS